MTDLSQRIAQLSPERLDLLLRRTRAAGEPPEATPISPRPNPAEAPLSFPQERLWFLNQLEGESPLYNMHAAFRMLGALDLGALAASLTETARRHETLRARFAAAGGGPEQHIEPQVAIAVPLAELGALPAGRRESEGERLLRAAASRAIDPARAPLFRLLLVRVGEREHLLSATFHHLIADGWSIGVFVRELSTLYEAFSHGRPSPLPELPLQYADFATWQRLALTSEVLAGHVTYWRQALQGAPALLDLPADRPRPAVRSSRGAAVPVMLPAGLTAALRSRALEEGATLYMALLAGFQALLARLSGQDDVLLGSPEAGRSRSETEGVIGPFVNTLVRRARFADDPSFRRLLARVREEVLAAAPHADLPFEKLVEALHPERSASFTPLFQAWLVLHNEPPAAIGLPDLSLRPLIVHGGTAKFDLTLEVTAEEGEIHGFFEHSLDLFDSATVERWAGHFATLLGRLANGGEAPLSSLPLLSDGEIRHLVDGWRAAETPTRPVADLSLDPPAATEGTKVAVRCGWEEISYEDLAGRSNQLAHLLRSRGVGPEVAVGLYVERSVDLIVGLLAILKAGGAAVPLDPKYPAERLEQMLADSGIALLITQQSLLFDLPAAAMACDLFCCDTEAYTLEEESREPLALALPPESLAYLIFTSGSTGTAKAVGVPRGALAAHLGSVADVFGLGMDDRVLQFASLSFDVAFEQILTALAAGATLVLRGEETWSARELDRQIVEQGVTVANLPTGFCQQWLDETDAVTVAGLRLGIAGGDALAPAVVRRWLELPGPARFLNAYGPTEGVITASFHDLESLRGGDPEAAVPIGRGLPGRRLYALDPAGAPVPPEVAGELHLAGPLARGYLGRPDSTAASFVPDSFATEPGARMYKTGDLVSRRPDGDLVFLGRADRQVKVRGFRIELGEIEESLRRHPGLRDAAAVIQGAGADAKRIVAYVVPADPGAVPSADELSAFLGERLPQHMVPAVFVPLPELPLTENGKLDRRALPDPDADRSERTEAGYVAPRTPLEEAMVGIWSEVMGLSTIGVHDDFFALGGHSLLGTLVIARIIETYEVELPLQSLFANPTVATFTARLEAELAQAKSAAPPIEPAPRTGDLPLSFAQQRLWFLEQMEPGTPVYAMPAALSLAGPLDADALGAAVSEVVRRHEVLRTTFAVADDRPVQVIASELALEIPRVDLSGLPPAEREEKVQSWAAVEAGQPFDLEKGPLLRLRLLRTGGEEHVLLLTLHHIVADAWSLGVLLREVADLYPALARGARHSLPPLAVQYADFAVWQRRWLTGEELARQLGYWRLQLSGDRPPLELPFARPRPERPSQGGALHRFEIDGEFTGELRELSQREGVTLFMTLLSTLEVLLYRLSGQEDFTVGTGIANRTHREVENLIGFFVNTLVLRANLAGNPSFRELAERVRTTALGAYAHQDLPFERLVEELRPGRELARQPLFQVMFQFQNAPMPPLRIGELAIRPLRLDAGTSHFDLTLDVEEDGDRLLGAVEYSTDLFDAPSIAGFVALLLDLLREVTIAPGLPILDLPLGVAGGSAGPSVAIALAKLEGDFVFEAGE